jgi:hypothetical protein
MSDLTPIDALIVDGYSGGPIQVGPTVRRGADGAMAWLLDAVERHALAEAEALVQYEELAEASGDPVIALIMHLILEDEERHHGLLRRIEVSLRDALEWTHSPAALPSAAAPRPALTNDLAAVASALIEEERTGAHKMRELANREKGLDAGLESLLLEMMALDSDKHARLLQFVHDRLAQRALNAA